MITERQEEQAALFAFGLLEGDERAAFEAEMARDRELAALVDSLVGGAGALALLSPPAVPPPELRARILSAATPPAQVEPFSMTRLFPWAIAAALAVSTAWFAAQSLGLRQENETLRTERRLAEVAYKTAQNQLSERSLVAEKMITELGHRLRHSEDLARLKVSALASLAGNTKEAMAIAVWDPDQQTGLLTFDKLPVIAASQDYQIWVVDPAYPDPVSGGVFHVDRDGHVALAFKPDQPVTKAAAFAISLEKKGGVPKAEGPIVMLGKLPSI